MRRATIIKSGPLTTIQDLGRRGGARLGLSPGGAMDRRALLWGNRLLGNHPSAAALEVTLGGLSIQFQQGTVLSITGADAAPRIDGDRVGGNRTVRVKAGQVLSLGYSPSGMRTYVSFPGGLDAPAVFGSSSAVVREGLPGTLGRSLADGESVEWNGGPRARPGLAVPAAFVSQPTRHLLLDFIPGYEFNSFTEEDREQLLTAAWTVTAASDRIATRLSGPSLDSGARVLDSVPLVDGTVQVLPGAPPHIFMRDRPTIGGYPKMGAVLPESLNALAQARPGTRVGFRTGDAAEARERMAETDRFFFA